MNKIKLSLIAVVLIISAIACKKKIENVSEVVTASYPDITINGSQFVSIPVGGTFADAGSTAKDTFLKEYNLQLVSIQNDIDPTTPGFYTVAYTYKNSNGYKSTATRFVLVTNVDSSQDISGVYLRGSVGTANVTKIATGLYKTDNVAGVPLPASEGFRATAYFGFTTDSLTIEIPIQNSPEQGPVGAVEGMYSSDSTGVLMQWRMVAGPYNTANTRYFVKQ